MSNKQYLVDAATRHQVFLQRLAGTEYKELSSFINKTIVETQKMLAADETIRSKKQLEKTLKDLTAINIAIYRDMAVGSKSRMINLARYEAGFTERLLDQAVQVPNKSGKKLPFSFTTPSLTQLKAAAFTTIIDATPSVKGTKGLTVEKALEQFGVNKTGDIVQAVRVGFALGKTNSEIANDIKSSVSVIADRQAQALARTVTNHVAAQSRQEFYNANSDVLEDFYTIVASLDDRTTLECAARDGQTMPIEDFEPPPYHWNCRTTYIREVKAEYRVDITGVTRAAKGGDGVELVSANTTFGSWIKNQPASFQDEVLGADRASLLRAGMSVDKFVDKNYKPLTIDELRTKDNEHIFKSAGL